MKITATTANLLACLFIAIMILLVSLNVNADEFGVYDEENHHADYPIKGDDGDPGKDAVGIQGIAGRDGRDFSGEIFNDNRLSRGIAITGAMSMIPALSHVGVHNHSGVGASAASYGNQNAIAIGFLHQEANRSYKATIGLSGSETLVGAGGSWAF